MRYNQHRLFSSVSSLFLIAVLALSGCSGQDQTQARFGEMLQQAQKLEKQQALLGWFYASEGKKTRYAETYENYRDLVSPAGIAVVEQIIRSTPDSALAREAGAFRRYLAHKYLAAQTAMLSDSLAALASARLPGGGFLADLPQLLAENRDPAFREALWQAVAPLTWQAVAVSHQLSRSEDSLAQLLGYPDYPAMLQPVYGIDAAVSRELGENILRASERLYRDLLQRLSPLPPAALRLADVYAIIVEQADPKAFPAAQMTAAMSKFLKGIGIHLTRQAGLTLQEQQVRALPLYAACAVIDAPRDVRISFSLQDGYDVYGAFFREMGRAQFALHIRNISPVFQQLRPSPLPDLFAGYFEHLLADPAWAAAHLDIPYGDPYFARRAFTLLFRLRLAAASLGGMMTPGSTDWQEQLSAALQIRLDSSETDWLRSCIPGRLAAARMTLLLVLEAQLRRYLQVQFGENWYEQVACGKFLKGIWQEGRRTDLKELQKIIGAERLEVGVMVAEVERMAGLGE